GVPLDVRAPGLRLVVKRFEQLLLHALEGGALRLINGTSNRSAFETHANYLAGCVLVGAAAARQLTGSKSPDSRATLFLNAEPFEGALWRLISMLQAGG